MTPNQLLLKAIRERGEKLTEFNGGILSADRYVKNVLDCAGSDLCYRYAAKGNTSFDDAVKRASKTLTYNNQDMQVEEIYLDFKARFNSDEIGSELVLPKHTLMVFRNTLTTPRKDRDGDILRTKGAIVDPKMLLLWQHVHTLPIGKMLGVAQHTSKTLELFTAIVDINELAHDTAVMVDNDMCRFSHGFRALEFEKMKSEDGLTKASGFDIKSFEVMEESVVTVPSNVDSEIVEVIVDYVEGGKLTSPMMKQVGQTYRANMSKRKSVGIEFDENGKAIDHDGKGKKGCTCGGDDSGASKEADEHAGNKEGDSEDDKMKEIECPKCGKTMFAGGTCKCGYKDGGKDNESPKEDDKEKGYAGDDQEDASQIKCPQCGTKLDYSGTCQKCGYIRESGKAAMCVWDSQKSRWQPIEEKAGAVLNRGNYAKLKEVAEDLGEIHGSCSTRSGKALCEKCKGTVLEVIKTAGKDDEDDFGKGVASSVKDAVSLILQKASKSERDQLVFALQALDDIDQQDKTTREFLSFAGN